MKRVYLVVIAAALTAVPVAVEAQPTFTESFTTTTYRDSAATSAHWDVVAGNLRLYPFSPTLMDTYTPTADAGGVAIAGDLAILADGTDGVLIVKIATPSFSFFVGSYNTTGYALDLVVAGDLAYVADGAGGLQIIDITNPAVPVLAGSYATPTNTQGVAVAADVAYLAVHHAGLYLLNITNSAAPTVLGIYNTSGTANDVAVVGDRVYVADGTSGLQIIDASNPASPSLLGTYNSPGNARDVAVAGDVAYVADFANGLQIVDVSNPVSPTLLASYDTPGIARSVKLSGDEAFVADGDSGMVMLDVSTPSAPVHVFTYDTPGHTREVAVAGEYAYAADANGGFHTIKIRERAAPVAAATHTALSSVTGLAVDGDRLLSAAGTSLEVLDISGSSPALIGEWVGNSKGVAVAGALALVASDTAFHTIDLSNPASPAVLGSHPATQPRSVAIYGDLGFVGTSYSGMDILDLSSPATPTVLSSLALGSTMAFDVAGDLLVVARFAFGIDLVDISNPSAPLVIGNYNTSTAIGTEDVVVVGDIALLASGTAGVEIVDISDPTTPVLLATEDTPSYANDVAVSGNLAVVSDQSGGVVLIDFTATCCPNIIESFATTQQVFSVLVDGEEAFVGAGTELSLVTIYQHENDASRRWGRSVPIDGGDDLIVRARITSNQTPSVTWQLSSDGAATFSPAVADGSWNQITTPGNDLVWKSELAWANGNAVISDVTFEWLNEFAWITAISDIPNDQGKQVRVEWLRSGRDFVGDAQQIVEYAVYRQIDPDLSAPPAAAARSAFDDLSPAARENALMMQAAGWDFLTTVPVLVEDYYAVVVPTLADSTIAAGQYHSAFRVSALTATPGVFWHSPVDSGYSVDDLAPGAPQSLVAAYNSGGSNVLTWDPAPEADFQTFRVYRSEDPNFVPSSRWLVGETGAPAWADPGAGTSVYYKITSVDFSGNESDPTAPGVTTSAPRPRVPAAFALYPNHPNPFNPSTVIPYDVPAGGGEVTLAIFDVGGRLVRTLIDGAQTPGHKRAQWSGLNASGQRVASGVYFARLTAGGETFVRKVVLAK